MSIVEIVPFSLLTIYAIVYTIVTQFLLRAQARRSLELEQKLTDVQTYNSAVLVGLQAESEAAIAAARTDAVKRSKAVVDGGTKENAAPFLIANANPKDYRHLGGVVDYIVFDGLHDLRNNGKDTIVIRFLEIKTNTSVLTKEQKAVKAAIEANRVEFVMAKIGD